MDYQQGPVPPGQYPPQVFNQQGSSGSGPNHVNDGTTEQKGCLETLRRHTAPALLPVLNMFGHPQGEDRKAGTERPDPNRPSNLVPYQRPPRQTPANTPSMPYIGMTTAPSLGQGAEYYHQHPLNPALQNMHQPQNYSGNSLPSMQTPPPSMGGSYPLPPNVAQTWPVNHHTPQSSMSSLSNNLGVHGTSSSYPGSFVTQSSASSTYGGNDNASAVQQPAGQYQTYLTQQPGTYYNTPQNMSPPNPGYSFPQQPPGPSGTTHANALGNAADGSQLPLSRITSAPSVPQSQVGRTNEVMHKPENATTRAHVSLSSRAMPMDDEPLCKKCGAFRNDGGTCPNCSLE